MYWTHVGNRTLFYAASSQGYSTAQSFVPRMILYIEVACEEIIFIIVKHYLRLAFTIALVIAAEVEIAVV